MDDQLLTGLSAFFQDPDATKLRSLLRSCLGEFNHLDFKENFPETPKLAKHILGMANTRGGCIVVGVADAKAHGGVHKPVGIATTTDPTVLGTKLCELLPETLHRAYHVLTFDGYAVAGESCAGRFFQVILVQPADRHLPFFPRKGTTDIDKDTIYVRRNAETVKAKKQDIDDIVKRLQLASLTEGRQSEKSLNEHLSQLSQLHAAIPAVLTRKKQNSSNAAVQGFGSWLLEQGPSRMNTNLDEEARNSLLKSNRESLSKIVAMLGASYESIPNPNSPAESYEAFVARMIEAKKRRIEQLLDL